jgi:hypothetical protein
MMILLVSDETETEPAVFFYVLLFWLRIFRQKKEMGNGEWLLRQQFLGMFSSRAKRKYNLRFVVLCLTWCLLLRVYIGYSWRL